MTFEITFQRESFQVPLLGKSSCSIVALLVVCAATLVVPMVQGSDDFGLGTAAVNSTPSIMGSQALHTATAIPDEKLLEKLNMLAYRGNLRALKSLVEEHRGVDWTRPLATGQRTAIHYALQGRHDSLSQEPSHLIGQHEEVVSFLIDVVQFNASHGCPVYYAMHYRNMRALKVLLKAGDRKQLIACLSTLDSTGETALHAAARSKASGFARLFARSLKNGGNQEVLDLLGLQPLKVRGSQRLSLQSLNSAISHHDIQMVLEFLQPPLNVNSLLDHQGNTLLHHAAYGGRLELVKFLLDAHMSVSSKNHFGLTPLDLAFCGHFYNIADLLAGSGSERVTWSSELPTRTQKTRRTCKHLVTNFHGSLSEAPMSNGGLNTVFEPDASQKLLWQRYIDSGWISQKKVAENLERCAIDIRNSSFSPEDFLTQYKGAHRPLVIQGLAGTWSAWKHWTKKELVKRYGSLRFTVSDVPYAELYHGTEAKATVTMLGKYVSDFGRNKQYPGYIFDGQILHWNSQLAQDAPIPKFFDNFTIVLKQFILGPTGSGAPPHFHRHAFNILVYGTKLWYLWPPSEAYFTFSHVLKWQSEHLQGKFSKTIECVQRPGDIVYIPENWGHAVVNLADSIAVAYEFV